MNLFGPLRCRSASGKKYILVITDAFSKYTELSAIPDKSANTVARSFSNAGFAAMVSRVRLCLIGERSF